MADRLPPVWAFYLALLVVWILFVNGVAWLDGSMQTGTLDILLPFIIELIIELLARFMF